MDCTIIKWGLHSPAAKCRVTLDRSGRVQVSKTQEDHRRPPVSDQHKVRPRLCAAKLKHSGWLGQCSATLAWGSLNMLGPSWVNLPPLRNTLGNSKIKIKTVFCRIQIPAGPQCPPAGRSADIAFLIQGTELRLCFYLSLRLYNLRPSYTSPATGLLCLSSPILRNALHFQYVEGSW